MLKLIPKPISPEQYLEAEKTSQVRHEFVEGTAYAMAGASRTHNRICMNISAFLHGIAPSQCRVTQADMKLRVEDDFFYPDVMAVCAPEPDDEYYETGPCILVEVLSESTKNIDLREKAWTYRTIPSLQTYLIVDSFSKTVRHIFRDANGEWQQENLTDSGTVALPCLGGSLELADIYQGML